MSAHRSQSARIDLTLPSLAGLHTRRSEKWVGHDPDVISSTIAEMDFPVAEPIIRALHAAIDRHDFGYAPATIPTLAEAFAGFAARRLGWRVDPDQITLLPDVMVGVLELARLLAGPNRSVACPVPAYPPFLIELPAAGLSVHPIPLTASRAIDLDALTTELATGTRVLILANPHNPTGHVLPRSELEQLAELVAAHDAWVIADEIHGPLVLPDAHHISWLTVSDAARHCGFALTSASKAFNLAGLKAALLITAADTARRAAAQLPPLTDHAGLLGVVAAEAAFTEGEPWLDAVLAQLATNRDLLTALLADHLPGIRWTPPEATYLAWLDCRQLGLGDDPAVPLLSRARVALSSGLEYGQVGAGHARLNFGTSPQLLTSMIDRLAAAVTERAGSRAEVRTNVGH